MIEPLAPGLRDFSGKEFYELMEKVFSVPQVSTLVQNKSLTKDDEFVSPLLTQISESAFSKKEFATLG